MSKNETYLITAICHNCGATVKEVCLDGTVVGLKEIAIPKGTTAEEFLSTMGCPSCGCTGYLKRRF